SADRQWIDAGGRVGGGKEAQDGRAVAAQGGRIEVGSGVGGQTTDTEDDAVAEITVGRDRQAECVGTAGDERGRRGVDRKEKGRVNNGTRRNEREIELMAG